MLAQSGVCRSVGISYRRHAFARCRPENREGIDAAIAEGAVRGYLRTTVANIAPHAVSIMDERGRCHVAKNDAVIVQIGGTAPTQLLESIGIRLVTKWGTR